MHVRIFTQTATFFLVRDTRDVSLRDLTGGNTPVPALHHAELRGLGARSRKSRSYRAHIPPPYPGGRPPDPEVRDVIARPCPRLRGYTALQPLYRGEDPRP